MKASLITTIAILCLSGCSTTNFFNNGPVKAHSTIQSLSIKTINSENPYFDIFKINSEYYAIGDALRTQQNFIDTINSTIILTKDQADYLRKACQNIIDSYDTNLAPGDDTKIIEYHLTLEDSEVSTSSQTTYFKDFNGSSPIESSTTSTSTSTEVKGFNWVIFRLQFMNSPKSLFGSGKSISYMYANKKGSMEIGDVQQLLNDLQK